MSNHRREDRARDLIREARGESSEGDEALLGQWETIEGRCEADRVEARAAARRVEERVVKHWREDEIQGASSAGPAGAPSGARWAAWACAAALLMAPVVVFQWTGAGEADDGATPMVAEHPSGSDAEAEAPQEEFSLATRIEAARSGETIVLTPGRVEQAMRISKPVRLVAQAGTP